jgi:hypothetical protein
MTAYYYESLSPEALYILGEEFKERDTGTGFLTKVGEILCSNPKEHYRLAAETLQHMAVEFGHPNMFSPNEIQSILDGETPLHDLFFEMSFMLTHMGIKSGIYLKADKNKKQKIQVDRLKPYKEK